MKTLKVAMLMDSWTPIEGGGQVHVREISKRLCLSFDTKIDFFTRSLKDDDGQNYVRNERSYDNRFRTIRLGFCTKFSNPLARMMWLFSVFYAVLKKNKRRKYDLIHAHAFLPGIPAWLLGKMMGVPVIFTVHGTSIGVGKMNILKRLEKFIVCKVKYDKQISVAHNFLKFKNVNKEIEVIANGVDLEKFDALKLNKNKVFTVLYVGRFDAIKGVDVLIKAFSKLSDLPIRLDLVGYGYDEANLKKLVDEVAFSTKIHFWGKLTGEELIERYKRSHLFVLPSHSEGQPLTVLEAWASKLPVIATKVGDNERIIDDTKDGFLVDPNNISKLSKVIRHCYNLKNLGEIGGRGYAKVKEHFSWDIAAQKTHAVYTSVLKKNEK